MGVVEKGMAHGKAGERVCVAVVVLSVLIGRSFSFECPTPFSASTDLSALGGASVNLFLDDRDFDGGESV